MVSDAFLVTPHNVWQGRERRNCRWKKAWILVALIITWVIATGAKGENPFEANDEQNSKRVALSQIAIRTYENASPDDWSGDQLPVATAYLIVGRPKEASALFQKIVEKDPKQSVAKLGYGVALMELEKYEEAVPLLQGVWDETGDVAALAKLVRCYARLGEYEKVHAIIPDLIDYKYDDLDSVMGALFNYATLEPDESRAVQAINGAYVGVPQSYIASRKTLAAEALAALGRFGTKLTNIEGARGPCGSVGGWVVTEKKETVPASTRDPRVQEELSEKSALTAISGIAAHAFENESRSWSAKERSVLAMGYADLKDDEEALDLYRVALAVIPNDGATLVGYGEALKRVGQIEEAIEVFRKALPTERHVEALTGLASCYLTLKRYDEFYLLGPRLLAHKYEGHNAGLIVLLDYARLAPDVERGKELLRKIIQEVPDEYLVHDFLLCGKAYGGSLRFGWNWTADLLAKDMGYFEWSMPGSYARARARRIAQVCEATAKRRFAEKVAATEAIFAVAKGPIVRGIEVRSENPYMTITPRAVLANMEVKIGKPYVESMVEADVRNLYATGAIANLRIFGQQLPNGVKIIVVIQEGLTP